jgi:hypothetical protein
MVSFVFRLDGSIDAYYRLGGDALFLERVSRFLGISALRIKIQKVANGSIIIDFSILEDRYFTGRNSKLSLNTTNSEFLRMVLKFKQTVGLRTIGLPWPVIDN